MVLQVGLAIGLVLLGIDPGLWWAAVTVLLLAAPLSLARWRGRWLVLWIQLLVRYLVRSHDRSVTIPAPKAADPQLNRSTSGPGESVIGPEDPRVALLRLVLPDLVVAHGTDHEREPLGLAWHQGTWTAVLAVDVAPSLITPIGGAPNLPLGALATCLEYRCVVLDAIQVFWHC
ncbi:MAG: hypothetical protein ACRDTF_12650 [Pseudonocardiaceae bacterium]